ncbi:hypothetical protein [Okeania sp. SIO2B3]|uniref:hypothetical protein n=1 Tax=Okeania sp. SIO2B3 TaxID=2607784 RepID=UPI0013BFD820|nr:hypothetical protein [Okeania sp. SIO2B3]NET46240.1 hypothetical protein [Okeania sp. SIO2B3]
MLRIVRAIKRLYRRRCFFDKAVGGWRGNLARSNRLRERCDPATTPVAPGSAPTEKDNLHPQKWY